MRDPALARCVRRPVRPGWNYRRCGGVHTEERLTLSSAGTPRASGAAFRLSRFSAAGAPRLMSRSLRGWNSSTSARRQNARSTPVRQVMVRIRSPGERGTSEPHRGRMSEQPLNLRRSLQILRRHLTIVGLFAVLGLLAGAGYTVLNPPMYTSSALVVLPDSIHSTTTQVVIADSDPVLSQRGSEPRAGRVAADPEQPRSGQRADPLRPVNQSRGQDRGSGSGHCQRCGGQLCSLRQHREHPGRTDPGASPAACGSCLEDVAAHSAARWRRSWRPRGGRWSEPSSCSRSTAATGGCGSATR